MSQLIKLVYLLSPEEVKERDSVVHLLLLCDYLLPEESPARNLKPQDAF